MGGIAVCNCCWYRYANADPHPYQHSDLHENPNSNPNQHLNVYPELDPDCVVDTDIDPNSDANLDRFGDFYAVIHANQNGDADTVQYANKLADPLGY